MIQTSYRPELAFRYSPAVAVMAALAKTVSEQG